MEIGELLCCVLGIVILILFLLSYSIEYITWLHYINIEHIVNYDSRCNCASNWRDPGPGYIWSMIRLLSLWSWLMVLMVVTGAL